MSNILDKLITEYAKNKAELDYYDKICKRQNVEIKEEMKSKKLTQWKNNNYVANYIVSNRESMNEDKLLELLKNNGYTHVIATKEYVNMDELEKSIYNGDIDKQTLLAMDKCKESKEVVTLKVSGIKKK